MTPTDPKVNTEQTFQLPDGRTLGFAEYGSTQGPVLVYCHGYPGSRLEAAVLSAQATEAQVRVLSLDRPGYGCSSFQEPRSFLDWTGDLVALTEHLGVDRFAIVGVSGGAPYALAAAYRVPEHLISCGIISGIGPLKLSTTGMSRENRLVLFLAHRSPWLLTPLVSATARSCWDGARGSRQAITLPSDLLPGRGPFCGTAEPPAGVFCSPVAIVGIGLSRKPYAHNVAGPSRQWYTGRMIQRSD